MSRVYPREFKESDLVLRRASEANMDSKLAPKWIRPYRVKEMVGKGAYKLKTLDGGVILRIWNMVNLCFSYCSRRLTRTAVSGPPISA